eukprot:scaffold128446_cov18-Tisochrysis_lutea.AAC.1
MPDSLPAFCRVRLIRNVEAHLVHAHHLPAFCRQAHSAWHPGLCNCAVPAVLYAAGLSMAKAAWFDLGDLPRLLDGFEHAALVCE